MLSVAAINDPQRMAQELASPDAVSKMARAASGDGRKVLFGDGRFDYIDAASGGMPDAPVDGKVYGRVNVSWMPVLLLTGGVMEGPLRLAHWPVNDLDAANKGYVDGKLALTGGNVTGRLTLAGDEVATRRYADTKLALSGGMMTGPLGLWAAKCQYALANEHGDFRLLAAAGKSYETVLTADRSALAISGVARKPGGGMWGDILDARAVHVTGNFSAGLAEVLKLYPVRYTYKGNDTAGRSAHPAAPYPESAHHAAAKDGMSFVGLIAQDCETAIPDMVRPIAGYLDGAHVDDLRMVDASAVVMALVNAVRDLATANKVLTARVAALEARLK